MKKIYTDLAKNAGTFVLTAAAATVVGAFIDPVAPTAGSNAMLKVFVSTGKWVVKSAVAGKSAAYVMDEVVSPIVGGIAESFPKKTTSEEDIPE